VCYNGVGKKPTLLSFEIINMTDIPGRLNVNDLIKLYQGGTSAIQLAKRLNVSDWSIRKCLTTAGIKLRNRSEVNALTRQQHPDWADAAHVAARGRRQTWNEMCQKALAQQLSVTHTTPMENALAEEIRQQGCAVIQQLAIGPYNADIALGSVAVEVCGRHPNGLKSGSLKRLRYIGNAGFSVMFCVISSKRKHYPIPLSRYAAHIISIAQKTSHNPPLRGQYWVVSGDGKIFAGGSTQAHDLSLVVPRIATYRPRGQDGRFR
jgi:very-short-patch-repair endonuclease